jgi:hypothetical protein
MTPHRLGNFATRYQSLMSTLDLISKGELDEETIAEIQSSIPEATVDFIHAIGEYNREHGHDPACPVMLNQSIYIPSGDQIVRIDTRMLTDVLTDKVLIAVYPSETELMETILSAHRHKVEAQKNGSTKVSGVQ